MNFGLGYFFASSQIHQIELRISKLELVNFNLQVNSKDEMRSGGSFIHICAPNFPQLASLVDEGKNILLGGNFLYM